MAPACQGTSALALLLLNLGHVVRAAPCEGEVCSKATSGMGLLQAKRHAQRAQAPAVDDPRVVLPEVIKLEDGSEVYKVPRLAPHRAAAIQQNASRGQIAAHMQAMLDLHNYYRCLHDVSALQWDAAIAGNAQAHADAGPDGGYGGHSTVDARKKGTSYSYVGENIAWSVRIGIDSTDSACIAANRWYDEIVATDGTPERITDTTPGNEGEAIGHFTQLVWKASSKLGCGLKISDYQMGTKTYADSSYYWVCQYGKGGNYQGEFTTNVLAASKSPSDCSQLPGSPLALKPVGTAGPTPSPTPAPPATGDGVQVECHDATVTYISYTGAAPWLACSKLKPFCDKYGFVRDACMRSCNKC